MEIQKVQPLGEDQRENIDRYIHGIQRCCLKHILRTLKIAGCYDVTPFGEDANRKQRLWTIVSIAYKCFVFTILLFSFGKASYAIFLAPSDQVPSQATNIVWITAGICNFLICQKAFSQRFGHQEHVFRRYNQDIIPTMIKMGVGFERPTFTLKQLIACLVGWIIVLVNSFCSILPMIIAGDQLASTTSPLEPTSVPYILQFLLTFISSMEYIFPIFYTITISALLKENFQQVNKFLKNEIHEKSCRVQDNIQNIREIHLKLCHATADFDKDLKYLYGNVVVWSISIGLFNLYIVLKDVDNTTLVYALFYWMILVLGVLAIMAMFAAIVHEEVRLKNIPCDQLLYNIVSSKILKTTKIHLSCQNVYKYN